MIFLDIEGVDKIIEGILENNQNMTFETNEVDEEFLNDFIIEAKEHIEKIEMAALNLENENMQREELNSLFREFHTIKGLAGFVDLILIQKLAHETETLLDYCRKGKIVINKEMIDAILCSADFIKNLCNDLSLNNTPNYCEKIVAHVGILSELIEKNNSAATTQERKSLNNEELLLGGNEKTVLKEGTIRIQVGKIDNLVDMVGELIINQSLIEQMTFGRFDSNDVFSDHVLRVSRIMKDLQNLSLSLRMVSLKSTFQKLRRIAHNTNAETGKNVVVNFSGEGTEIDRSIADKLLDPLIHIIKNSFSHGIEEEPVRVERGKPKQGTINVEAYRKKGNVYIVISDDGAGICTDIICKKALEKGLLQQNTEYLREEIRNIIFSPGFSTAKKIDNISGRGVGMDVVKTEVSKIGGKVELYSQSSGGVRLNTNRVCPCVADECLCERSKGLKVVLKIPINMAIINGTIVDINGTKYILPTLQVKKIFKPEPEQWVFVKGSKAMIKMRDEIIPVIPIAQVFGLDNFSLDNCILVIVEHDQKLRALPVSDIVDKREIVVKALGECFQNLNYAAGASILGDGKVAIIIDVEHLFTNEEVR